MVRSSCCDKLNVRRGPWTVEEDAKILAYVSKHGTGNWTAVPKKTGLQRCSKSCRLRWTNYLRPDLKHDSFTPQEEEMVIKLHAAIGSRWSIIAQQLPGRTDNDVKNYWNTKLRKKLSEMGIDPVTHKPFTQILVDYGNIGGFPKSRARIGSLNRDLKNAFVLKPEPCSSQSPEGIPNINSHWMAPKMEPLQDCFFNNNDTNMNHSFDILDQLQAIKMVTEASSCAKYETISPQVLNESSLSSAASSSSSSTCSTAAQEEMPLGFSWQEFLLEDAFLQSDQHEQHNTEELSSKDTASQGQNVMPKSCQNMTPQGQLNCRMTMTKHNAGVEGMDPAVTISNGFQVPTTTNTSYDSFVESILDREKEMFLDFPGLLEEPFHT